jgi:hypothetical protein
MESGQKGLQEDHKGSTLKEIGQNQLKPWARIGGRVIHFESRLMTDCVDECRRSTEIQAFMYKTHSKGKIRLIQGKATRVAAPPETRRRKESKGAMRKAPTMAHCAFPLTFQTDK